MFQRSARGYLLNYICQRKKVAEVGLLPSTLHFFSSWPLSASPKKRLVSLETTEALCVSKEGAHQEDEEPPLLGLLRTQTRSSAWDLGHLQAAPLPAAGTTTSKTSPGSERPRAPTSPRIVFGRSHH